MTRSGPPRFLLRASTVGLLVHHPRCCPRRRAARRLPGRRASRPPGLALQVALDRAGFSPGAIDGAPGRNTRAALQRFQEAKGLPASGTLDDATRQALPADPPLWTTP